jgi:hypothetical protein
LSVDHHDRLNRYAIKLLALIDERNTFFQKSSSANATSIAAIAGLVPSQRAISGLVNL